MTKITLLVFLICIITFSCDSNNIVKEEPEIDLGKKIISIDIPKNFMREDAKLHIVLFDINGGIIDSKLSSN